MNSLIIGIGAFVMLTGAMVFFSVCIWAISALTGIEDLSGMDNFLPFAAGGFVWLAVFTVLMGNQ